MNEDENNKENPTNQSTSPTMGGTEDSIDTEHAKNRTNTPQHKKSITAQFYKLRIDSKWGMIANLFLIGITASYTYFAHQQWQTIKEQADITANQIEVMKEQTRLIQKQIENTSKQFAIENRAWVNISDASHTEFKAGEKVICKITFTNTGKSPALKMRIHAQIGIFNESEPSLPITPPREKGFSEMVLGPSIQLSNGISMSEPITEENIAAIKQGTAFLFVWGVITYDDILGDNHKTTFCLYNGSGTKDFNGCSDNNTMD